MPEIDLGTNFGDFSEYTTNYDFDTGEIGGIFGGGSSSGGSSWFGDTDWGGVAGGVGNLIGGIMDRDAGREAAEQMAEAMGQISEDARRDAGIAQGMSDPYSQYRPAAAEQLSGILSGEIDFRTDPGYKFRMDEAMRETGRAGAARGFNRSGNVMAALDTRAQGVASEEYNKIISRLTGLAGATPENAIAGGQVYGSMMGDVYSAQTSAAANQAQATSGGGMGDIIGAAVSVASMFSDKRLKVNIKLLEEREGYNWYSWDWNDKAADLGLTGYSEGVIADELQETHPELVTTDDSGYLQVNYEGL